MSRQRKTVKSSRIPPQAREYISEMAEDRELERFMALSSTASSGASGSLHTCAVRRNLTTETDAGRSSGNGSRPSSGHRGRRSGTRLCHPAIGAASAAAAKGVSAQPPSPTVKQSEKAMKSQESFPSTDSYRIIPIVLVDDQSKPRPAAATQTMSLSVEDLRTPTKLPAEMQTKKTQTPESALKSHKRLEWDPAADVGYYKRAVSTSNISTLERSVLEECGWRQPVQQRSETDLDKLQHEKSEHKTDSHMREKPTVPLASSTMVGRPVASPGASVKVALHISSREELSNNSSRGEPQNSKREAGPSTSSSEASHCCYRGSSLQADSNCSSRKGTTSLSSSRKRELLASCPTEALHGQVSSGRESLISSRRESLASNPQTASRVSSRAESFHTGSRMGSERSSMRESQATSLGSSAASSFDYHSNLAEQELKSMQKQQQKEPQRSEQWDRASDKQEKEPSRADHREKHQRTTEQSESDQKSAELRGREQSRADQQNKKREQERQITAAQFERILGSRRRENKENQLPPTQPAAPEAGAGHKRDLDLGIDLLCSLVEARSLSQVQKKKLVREIARRISCLDLTESSSTATSSSRGKYIAPVPLPFQHQDLTTNTSLAGTQVGSSPREPPLDVVTLPVPAPRQRNADGTPSPLPSSSFSPTISSSSASKELITQKANIPTGDAASTDADVDADAEPMSAIRDALNPMTQSEIEYEERMKEGMDPERRSQLNWIEAEIKRLQSLKGFLADIDSKLPDSSVPVASDGELVISSDELILVAAEGQQEKEKEELSSAARRIAKVVQTEDFVEIEENPIPKPPVRVESVRTPSSRPASSLQAPAPPLPPPHRYPRTKMATPILLSPHSSSSGSVSGGGGRSESVSSFVQQRHRRFREHYQNQQQQKLLLIKQQQLQRLQQQLHQHKHHTRALVHGEQHIRRESHCPIHAEQQRGLPHREEQEHREQQQYMQMMQYEQTAASGSAYATPHSSASGCYSCADNERAIYYQVVNSPGASASYVQAEPEAPAGNEEGLPRRIATNSASSMTCPSSEMSIHVGRVNTCETTTITTTTHQYDDVVACQRRKRRGGVGDERMERQTLQVRPRGIAYVIQFTTSGGNDDVVPETRSLQDQLQLARPEFCAKSKQRKAILNQMQMMRNLRRREMDELVAEHDCSLETLDRRLLRLPPPATTRLRVFTTKEMKAMTTRHRQSLPEVLDAVNRELDMRTRRTNRLMRDIFNKRMRSRVSSGQVSLNHSKTII